MLSDRFMRMQKNPTPKLTISLITQMKTQFDSNNAEELLHLLYNFIVEKEGLNVTIAKALIRIVCHDHPNSNIKQAAFELLDLIYEERSNGKTLHESSYYIGKVLAGKKLGTKVTAPKEGSTAEVEEKPKRIPKVKKSSNKVTPKTE